ncbi:MAG: biotin--[acetyl-CoA-carboxylase] ligase [Thermoplasmata archaeon HGW-Thermoplasmata-2]|nr:MAG: biotin--[acetyl-CoA-carboxylase] ligase [Thermoplasmata archaeon HGW-Thermoplasmata-2]
MESGNLGESKAGKSGEISYTIMRFKETESTNLLARKLASEGAPEGTVVAAERQTGGRGRLGRKWHSPNGGLWFSVILRSEIAPKSIHKFTMSAGIAVAESLRELGADAKIKWPNDVLIGGKKVCGMLSETAVEGGRILFVILGIGINSNVDSFPPEISDAVSLSTLLGRKIDNDALLADILKRFADLRNKPDEFVARRWTELSGTIGRRVRIKAGGNCEIIEGIAERIDEDGVLVVDGKRILAGDCEHLRTVEGMTEFESGKGEPKIENREPRIERANHESRFSIPESRYPNASIKLRGHHLLCIFGFRGKGYDEKFAENMGRIVAALKCNPNTRILVVEGCDDICAFCPSRKGSACFLKGRESDMEIREQDAEVLARLETAAGSEIRAGDLPRIVASQIKPSDLKTICRGCDWLTLGFCEEGIRKDALIPLR